jgi:hypothetical protein
MPYITYPQFNGQVAVIIPADPSLSIEEIATKDVPEGVPYKIIDNLNIDYFYFNAYEFNEEDGAVINIYKAKEIHLNKFREVRKPLLEALDVQYMKALETGDQTTISYVVSSKQALRDVTKISLPDNLADIKNTWPNILGSNPL